MHNCHLRASSFWAVASFLPCSHILAALLFPCCPFTAAAFIRRRCFGLQPHSKHRGAQDQLDGSEQQADFAGISLLTSFEALSLITYGNFRFNPEFEALTKLTSLSVSAESTEIGCSQEGYVDWESLQALHSLHTLSRFTWDVIVLGLAELENLRVALFSYAKPEDLLCAGSVECY